ncbi:hypothetical protein [Catenulispora rubra]|uniref:hypothetical protein n=1 Tax=Catenulispora rubra TaxID=280293 RepID=UPI0018926C48|nr:hypothetical protein [Catenulispora rubra]
MSTPPMAGPTTDAVVARARDRQRRHFAGGIAAGCVAALGVSLLVVSQPGNMHEPTALGSPPPVSSGTATGALVPTSSGPPTLASGGHACPGLITPTADAHGVIHGVTIDYADVLEFYGHDYQSADNTPLDPADLGASVGQVVCTLATPSVSYVDPGYRMQDGDATFIPSGGQVYSVKGVPAEQELAAEHDGVMHVYRIHR